MNQGMTIVDMLGQSALLTVQGIAIVFTFIIILIICMTVVAKVVGTLKLDKGSSGAGGGGSPSADNNAVVAAIATALKSKS
ncbi:MAG: hypothetical protein Ta2A_01470 [Treponemataceae bacterium]|nr:MAG: hypothetical protein Ta2A_01470 [Treponemataceae bacterium]